MIKVVLDTNVLVSSLLTSGPPAAIVDLITDSRIIPHYNDLILQEYWDVLTRKKFSFSSLQVTRLINDILRSGIVVDYKQSSNKTMIDEDDQIFYDAAFEAKAYLITGNTRHFPPDSLIVSPAQFLSILFKG